MRVLETSQSRSRQTSRSLCLSLSPSLCVFVSVSRSLPLYLTIALLPSSTMRGVCVRDF